MDQSLINTIIGLVATLFGWVIRILWTSVTDLQKQDKDLADKVNSIEVLVVGDYVKRDELHSITERIFTKLDSIENKIDHKVDK